MTNYEAGRRALQMYYSNMRLMYPRTFTYSFEEMLTMIKKLKGAKNIEEGLGLAINPSPTLDMDGISDSKVSAAMRRIAVNGGGKIPASYMDFFNSLMSETAKINYVDALLYTATETAKTVGGAVVEVGDQLIFTGKILNFLLPVIILLFVWFFLDDKSGGRMTKIARGFKK